MGMGLRPDGTRVFGTFLKAQEDSPTLTLAYAGLGDEGVLEIAHFLGRSTCLIRLDLTGNDIGSTGAFHLAKALKINLTLESLILKHNNLGEDEAGIAALCRALHGNQSLRHLDLRRNILGGALVTACVGELLQHNRHLTHLELSWNLLEPTGGHELLKNIQLNTTLFDCQLTGCRIAHETLIEIARLLHRNRKVKGANMMAGPFQACIERCIPDGKPENSTRGALDECVLAVGGVSMLGRTAQSAMTHPQMLTGMVISNERTNELMTRLIKWIESASVSREDAAQAREMYEYLRDAQNQLIQDRNVVEGVHNHSRLLGEGFRERELRYRKDIAAAQAMLQDYATERQGLAGIFSRFSEELQARREASAQEGRDLETDRRQQEANEGQLKNELAIVVADKREVAMRLEALEAKSQKLEDEYRALNARAERLRSDIVLLTS